MELYYENYYSNRKGYCSLPYAIRIPDRERRAAFGAMLKEEGFQCVVGENEYPVMYVNFTLKRYGRNVKACGSSAMNKELLTEEQFMTEIFARYKNDAEFRAKLENNYYESAKKKVESYIRLLKSWDIMDLAQLREKKDVPAADIFALKEIEQALQQMLDFA